jgi:hypothetical protein
MWPLTAFPTNISHIFLILSFVIHATAISSFLIESR